MVANQVAGIDYPNFKAEAESRETRRHDSHAYVDALHRVWTDLGRIQHPGGGPYSIWPGLDDEWDEPAREEQ